MSAPDLRAKEGTNANPQSGHEYTKANVAFSLSVTQNEATRKLGAFMQAHQESQGQFTIGDEKVSLFPFLLFLILWFERLANGGWE